MKKYLFSILILSFSFVANAKLKILTTTSTMAALAHEIGQNKVDISSLTAPSQDPHFVEAKPSYMVKVRSADLLIAVGLDLEIGWLPNIQRGARNPKIMPGQAGFFSAGDFVSPIEKQSGKTDRSEGDVHPLGNPHFHLSPSETLKVTQALSEKMGELDPENLNFYQKNQTELAQRLQTKIDQWKKRVLATGIKQVLTYHRSLNYFLDFFNLVAIDYIEPKAGVPPTAKHIIDLIEKIKTQNIKCILNENYFETTAALRLQQETKAHVESVPVEAESSYAQLIETLVTALEKCKGE